MIEVYADFNATSPLSSGAKERMEKAVQWWGNPSSQHHQGRRAKAFLEESREIIADCCGVSPSEVVFTSGGSEANTTALWGSALLESGAVLISTPVEHSSCLDTLKMMSEKGICEPHFLSVTASGQIDLGELEKQIQLRRPCLVSIQAANNETGVLFPLSQVMEICRKFEVPFHTDAVQALGKVPEKEWNGADFISLSAHKIGGPKGVGALIVKKGRKLVSTHYGGSQEIKRRGGTENTMGIAGFAGACLALQNTKNFREDFEKALRNEIPSLIVNGESQPRLSNTSNLRVPGISAEVLLSAFDIDGLFLSAGSACSSGSISPSHVLLAMGLSTKEARECFRVSWGPSTTGEEIHHAVKLISGHVNRIQARNKKHGSH